MPFTILRPITQTSSYIIVEDAPSSSTASQRTTMPTNSDVEPPRKRRRGFVAQPSPSGSRDGGDAGIAAFRWPSNHAYTSRVSPLMPARAPLQQIREDSSSSQTQAKPRHSSFQPVHRAPYNIYDPRRPVHPRNAAPDPVPHLPLPAAATPAANARHVRSAGGKRKAKRGGRAKAQESTPAPALPLPDEEAVSLTTSLPPTSGKARSPKKPRAHQPYQPSPLKMDFAAHLTTPESIPARLDASTSQSKKRKRDHIEQPETVVQPIIQQQYGTSDTVEATETPSPPKAKVKRKPRQPKTHVRPVERMVTRRSGLSVSDKGSVPRSVSPGGDDELDQRSQASSSHVPLSLSHTEVNASSHILFDPVPEGSERDVHASSDARNGVVGTNESEMIHSSESTESAAQYDVAGATNSIEDVGEATKDHNLPPRELSRASSATEGGKLRNSSAGRNSNASKDVNDETIKAEFRDRRYRSYRPRSNSPGLPLPRTRSPAIGPSEVLPLKITVGAKA
ncbi:hypothetical protein SISSUDRAFT_1042787 [Sistotremastrum suecicum HHB10207 ss-3]|uniref:Uncharacterized protein n=1 Tax=Sistotremastrum suecicum HHB10207 ss-3 TaxID=1314776 RepID=A0A166G962_9AGAM|nr:hypothetical protein SISSUDRAFT_1042787 [Sistotremastrum suecicum HHB10207 ss-3]